jgi:Gluconate 2-dehydrogenase subunit 3
MSEDTRKLAPLSEEDRQTLSHVLDQIIPPDLDRQRPGAGELGLAAYVDAALDAMPVVKEMVVQSLAAADDLARRRSGSRLNALPLEERVAVLDQLAAGEHAFPPVLVLHAYAGYYQHPRVLEALGLEPRPPHPAGYPTIEGDLTLLDAVRRRARMYRQC